MSLPTLNDKIGQFHPQMPGNQQNQPQPQQQQHQQHHQNPQHHHGHHPHGNWPFPHFNWHHPHGHWNQPHGNKNNQQPPQGNWNQPPQEHHSQQEQPPQENWNQPPQQPGYAQQQGYPQPQQWGFDDEIKDMKTRYNMNIPDDQIDKTIDEAKSKKRMYAFPDQELNYVRYDDKGRSYIASTHGFKFAHFDNKDLYTTKNDPNSYDGTAKHLTKTCFLDIKIKFNHVTPGNYKLFLNQCFENDQLKGKVHFKVFVCDKEVFAENAFPTDEMVKSKTLSEVFIKDIKYEDFDTSKLDQNGDGVIRLEFGGNDGKTWKKGWTIDGARLLDLDQPPQDYYNQQNYPSFQPQQPGYAQQQYQPYQQGQPPYQSYQPYVPYNFSNEIRDMKNKYGMNFPDDQIDQSIDEAKSKKRMYPFPEQDLNYVRYDDKGKSFIASTHGFKFAHFDNKDLYTTKNDPNSYDGTAKHLIKTCYLDIKIRFNHVIPGNYKLFLNQCFENDQLKGKAHFKVFVCDKEVYAENAFPTDEMVKSKTLSEVFIKDIKYEDFDMSKLDKNGDAVIRLEFGGNDGKTWKKGWTIDGARLLAC